METTRIDKKIDFKIDGLEEDRGSVRLSVFREKMDQLTKLLSDAERQAAHVKQAKSLYALTDLSYSSAYTQITPFVEADYDGSVRAIDLLKTVMLNINSEVDSLGDVQSSLIKKIHDLCGGAGEKFKAQTLTVGGEAFALDAAMASKAQKYLDKKYFSFGEIKGRVERVNIHDRHDFYLYLDLNGNAVICHFREETLLQKVRSALGKTVIASGRLQYVGTDVDPISAAINEIDIVPDDYLPPGENDLFGIAPNLTNDKEIGDYIRKVRGEWSKH
ncbi:hypothetical protein [Porticoccus sp.]